MYRAVLLPLAKQDISEAASWYNTKQKGLGKRFIEELRIKVLLIRKNPKISSIRYDDVRTMILDAFPFMIHYSIDDQNKTIIIAAIFNTSIDPERWKSRR